MNKNKSILMVTAFALSLGFVSPVEAAGGAPDFGTCVAPKGEVIASYANGVHGIPGKRETFKGSDTVYKISQDVVLQCFCPENGKGIQTNWLRAKDLSKTEIAKLRKQGWVYIATGSVWGLDDVAYLAKNVEYTCKAGVATKGLANTGNLFLLNTLLLGGMTTAALAFLLKKFRK